MSRLSSLNVLLYLPDPAISDALVQNFARPQIPRMLIGWNPSSYMLFSALVEASQSTPPPPPPPTVPLSLLEELAQIPDPRDPKGQRHPLAAILALVVLAMLTGAKSYTAIAQFGRDKGFALAHILGFRRGKTPAKSTLSELFKRLDVAAFEAALSRWIGSRLPPNPQRQICLDGKVLCGSKDGDVPGHHLVSAYAPDAEAVLAQLRVDCKTNEHKAALELLGILPLKGAIITGDSMFCQRDITAKVIAGGGNYVFIAKDNQRSLVVDIGVGLAFDESARRLAQATPPYLPVPRPAGSTAKTVNKGHGRVEIRTIEVTPSLTKSMLFAGLKQGFRLTRERREKGKTTIEVVHGITSLDREQADATRLLELTRDQWGIENGSHYRRDVTLGEDACRVRSGSAPQILAGIRNAIIHLVKDVATSLAAAIRKLNNCFPQALDLLGLPQLQ